jgi:probable HAF family extracellular repeat protein
MKFAKLAFTTAMTFLTLQAVPVHVAAQEQQEQNAKRLRYTVTDLGLAGPQSYLVGVNNKGWVDFTRLLPDGTGHAFFGRRGINTDLGTLGGPNSSAYNGPGTDQVVGKAETATPDPLGEDFCGYGTNLICLAFIWQNGQMTPLPTLGGNNGWAWNINNRDQVAGFAENTTSDPTCQPPQVLENKPAIWEKGEIRELPTIPGDPDGQAFGINDQGQAVGTTGNCTAAFHSVLWEKDGEVKDLGNFGGPMNNVALNINNRGEVVGYSDVTGDTTTHAFLWTEDHGMTDLGTLPGDVASFAFGINNKGQVVGQSCDVNFNCRAFLWQDSVMTDLNQLIPPGSPLYLGFANEINSRGAITGVAGANDGDHAFLATPCDGEHADKEGCESEATAVAQSGTSQRPRVALPENVRNLLRQRLGPR